MNFKFLRGKPVHSEEEENAARSFLVMLIMTGEYETTIYPKVYDNQYVVNSVTVTNVNNEQRFISNISVVGGGDYNFNLYVPS